MPQTSLYEWVGFIALVAIALAADFWLVHRRPHEIGLREALAESARWIGLSLAFGMYIWLRHGREMGIQFAAGYLLEKSMSVDNIFVFVIIFDSMRIPARWQHRVLFYGIFGALLLRGAFVFAGVALLERFHSILFVFGAILLFTGIKMLVFSDRKVHPERNWLVRLARWTLPFTDRYDDGQFSVREDGAWKATTLLLAVVAVEAMDIVFAVDSVPAVLSITRDVFIAFSSNVLAILGLRALYFALKGVLSKIRYLHYGLAVILIFVAVKMFASDWFEISASTSLLILAIILAITVSASLVAGPTPPADAKTQV